MFPVSLFPLKLSRIAKMVSIVGPFSLRNYQTSFKRLVGCTKLKVSGSLKISSFSEIMMSLILVYLNAIFFSRNS